jgi:hypothetical protein
MGRFLDTLRTEWPTLALEFLVLVVGVTLSFAVDQWRRDDEDRRYEQRALTLIREGLVSDSVRGRRVIAVLREFRRAHEGLLEDNPPADSVDRWMDLAQSYIALDKEDWAYQELRLGGNTRVLRNNRVFSAITAAYGREYYRMADWEEINRRIVLDRIIPYVDDNSPFVPITAKSNVISGLSGAYAVLRTQDRFRNLQRTAMAYREAQIGAVEGVIARIRTLLPQIDSARTAR